MVEAAVRQRTAEPFVKEQEQERDLDTFNGELIGVPGAIAFQQPVPFQLSQIVAELVQTVGRCWKAGRW